MYISNGNEYATEQRTGNPDTWFTFCHLWYYWILGGLDSFDKVLIHDDVPFHPWQHESKFWLCKSDQRPVTGLGLFGFLFWFGWVFFGVCLFAPAVHAAENIRQLTAACTGQPAIRNKNIWLQVVLSAIVTHQQKVEPCYFPSHLYSELWSVCIRMVKMNIFFHLYAFLFIWFLRLPSFHSFEIKLL